MPVITTTYDNQENLALKMLLIKPRAQSTERGMRVLLVDKNLPL
jgi:hypothetical protein